MSVQLIHGDCLVEMDAIPDGSIDMILCDLPYGTTACKWDTVIPFEPLWAHYKRVIKRNGAIVLFGSQPFTSALVMSNPAMFRYEWVWEKGAPVGFLNAKRVPLKDHENVAVFYEASPTYSPQGLKPCLIKSSRKNGKTKTGGTYGSVNDREYWATAGNYPRSVLHFQRETNKQLHPTQKPVALLEYLVRTYTNEGETVLDNTMGSGSTGVACINTNRAFIGIEMDAGYFDIASKRIEAARNSARQSELELVG